MKALFKSLEKEIDQKDIVRLYYGHIHYYEASEIKEKIREICSVRNIEFIDTGSASIVVAAHFGPKSMGVAIEER